MKDGYYEENTKVGPRIFHEGEEFMLVEKKGLIAEKRPILDQITGKPVTDYNGKVRMEPTGRNVPHVFTPEEQFSATWMEKVSEHPTRKVPTPRGPVAVANRSKQPGGSRVLEPVEELATTE
jgi:hypothetical protein